MWTVLNPPWVPVLRREPALVLDPRTNREGGEQAIHTTLQTLAEHLTREEARQAAGLLPVELVPRLHTGGCTLARGKRSASMSTSSCAGSASARRLTCSPHSVMPPPSSPH
ncbi:MAG TPA: hypothetical protein VK887_15440 [Pseudonocardiaceae bacterium]|nr:hypothetical protein [Pseudonocardiaceae bacterium]